MRPDRLGLEAIEREVRPAGPDRARELLRDDRVGPLRDEPARHEPQVVGGGEGPEVGQGLLAHEDARAGGGELAGEPRVVVVPGPGVDDERLVAVADHMDVHVGQEGAVHAKLDAPDLGLFADERASEAVGVEREAPGVADGPVDTRVPLTRHGGAPLC